MRRKGKGRGNRREDGENIRDEREGGDEREEKRCRKGRVGRMKEEERMKRREDDGKEGRIKRRRNWREESEGEK